MSISSRSTEILLRFNPAAEVCPFRLPHLGFSLASALRSRRAALDSPSLWTLDVVSWNPFLVVCLRAGCHGWDVCASDWNTLISSTLLGGAALRAITTSATLLWEVWCDPDSVEEVNDADEAGKDEEVEEDTKLID